ncbi:MAG TPA: hypothetical protein PK598_16680 [Thermoanaerobaculia bacterium]|nr:hypothetical protein [Thermoanaerobaculia bacterium]
MPFFPVLFVLLWSSVFIFCKAALVDWDPGDLPIVPVLLDLPEGASREAMRQRAIAWCAAV